MHCSGLTLTVTFYSSDIDEGFESLLPHWRKSIAEQIAPSESLPPEPG